MEKVMSFLINSAKKAADFLLCVVKKDRCSDCETAGKGRRKSHSICRR